MISKRDVQLGKIALKLGMVSKEQINGCLALKKKLAETKGKKVALGALLLKKGYLTEEQLEECVRLHNEEHGDDDGDQKRSGRSKRRSARLSARAEAAGDDAEGRRSRRSKRARAEEPQDSGNGTGQAASEEQVAVAEATPEKPEKPDKPDKADKAGSGKRKSAPVETAGSQSEVDSSVFQSAPEDAVDEEDRRLIACPECAKPYRIRKKQVGKRFSCRRCKGKVKVPKDLFSRPLAPPEPPARSPGAAARSGKKASKESGKKEEKKRSKEVQAASGSGVEVEEFTLGSGDQTSEEPDATPSQRVGAAAAAVAASVEKVQKASTIADLAKAATKAQTTRLPAKTRFGVKQAITLAVCLATLGGGAGGIVLWNKHVAAKAEEERQARLAAQLKEWSDELLRRKQQIEAAIADPGQVHSLKTLLAELEKVAAGSIDLAAENHAKAATVLAEVDTKGLARQVMVAQFKGYRSMGGPHLEEALRSLIGAAELAPGDEELQRMAAEQLISARRPREAIARLEKLGSPAARALLALAYERSDQPEKAAETYQKLDDPLGPVLAARSWLLERNHAKALEMLGQAEGLSGQDLAAAKVVEARARELAKDRDGARAAYDAAAQAGADSPFPRLALGEFLLREGRTEEALQTIREGNRVFSSARGYLALGDALAATLDLEGARSTWREAASQALVPEKSRTVGQVVDPFLPVLADDPRAVALCRVATLHAAAGEFGPAQQAYESALQVDPFHPEAHAGLGHLDLLLGSPNNFTEARIAQALKLCSRGGGVEGEPQRTPTAARVLIARAAQLTQAGKSQEALEALSHAQSADPVVAPLVDTLRIRCFTQLGQETKAIDAAKRVLQAEVEGGGAGARAYAATLPLLRAAATDAAAARKLDHGVLIALAQNPYHGQALLLRARLRIAEKKVEAATADLDRAERVNPFLREVFVVRGFLNVRDLPAAAITRDSTIKAQRDFDVAVALEQKLQLGVVAETQYGLALVQHRLSNYREALACLDKCIAADKAYVDAYRLRATIRRHLKLPGADEDEALAKQLEAKSGQGQGK